MWLYYTLAIILYIFILYLIMKHINEKNTYLIQTKDGKILEGCRSKAMANVLLSKHKNIQRRNDIIIKKVKDNGYRKKE